MTQFRLTTNGGQQDLPRLADWLRSDEVVGEQAEIELVQAAPKTGEMGLAFEAVQAIVDNGFQVANLVVAIAAYRRTRPSDRGVVIERDQVRVTIDTDDPAKIAQIVQALDNAS
ncbi:effector-associated constant component EACC1 [Streptomyces sp. NPDC055051]